MTKYKKIKLNLDLIEAIETFEVKFQTINIDDENEFEEWYVLKIPSTDIILINETGAHHKMVKVAEELTAIIKQFLNKYLQEAKEQIKKV